MRSFILLLITAAVMGGCASNEVANSGDVKQSSIYQGYSIRYDEDENITWATATFRFGGENGTTLLLTPPSTITFNGDSMRTTTTALSGAYYTLAFKRPLENGRECIFEFTDTEGKKYTNKLKFNPVLMGTPVAEIKKGLPLEIPLFTAPLLSGEQLSITVKDTAKKETFLVEKVVSGQPVIIPATVLKELNGKVTIEIERFAKIPMQQAAEQGGEITFSYTLKPRQITIVP